MTFGAGTKFLVRNLQISSMKFGALWFAVLTMPSAASAEVCDKERPLWDPSGGPATAWDEFLHLASTPATLILLLVTALAVRFRSAWGGLAAVCGWSLYVGLRVFGGQNDPTGITQMAQTEGCIGAPSLFIAVVAAISVATILYTAPAQGRPDTSDTQEK